MNQEFNKTLWLPKTTKIIMTFENGNTEIFESIVDCAKKHFNSNKKTSRQISGICTGIRKSKKDLVTTKGESVKFKFHYG